MTRVAFIDDHESVRLGLEAACGRDPNKEVVFSGDTVTDYLKWRTATRTGPADVVVLDLTLGDGTTVTENVARLVRDGSQVIIHSVADRPAAVREALAAGAAGVIVPDLPLGEDEPVREALAAAGLAVVPLVAPTTLGERRERICRIATGFVYVVAEVGTTGERDRVPEHLQELVEDVRSHAEVPVAVGFGISGPEHAAAVGRVADGVIIGSKLVRLAGEAGPEGAPAAVGGFLAETAAALRADRGGTGAATG